MSSGRTCGLSVGLLTLAIPLILMVAACADDGNGTPAFPGDSPTPDGEDTSPTTSGRSVIGAVTAYITDTGLDGETFEVTEPINCNAFVDFPEEDKPFGKICINFNKNVFTDTSGVIEVREYGAEVTWDVTLELRNTSWVVTGAEETTTEADGQ